jgi:hypothetical protein
VAMTKRAQNKVDLTAGITASLQPYNVDALSKALTRIPVYRPGEREALTFMQGLKAHIERIGKSLQDNQQVFMYCWHGPIQLQVLNISMPSDNVVAMHCLNSESCDVHVTGHMHSITFSFEIRTLVPPAVRTPIGFNMPSSK